MNEADEARIEQQLKQQGADAPRLSPEHIDQTIVDEAYYIFPNTTVTVCCLTLRNGFKVIGKSAAANTANFNEEIGRKVARANAREQIWELEGYLLKERLHNSSGVTMNSFQVTDLHYPLHILQAIKALLNEALQTDDLSGFRQRLSELLASDEW